MSSANEIQRRVIKDNENRRGIDEALDHVVRGWFPINTALLNSIRTKSQNGDYKRNPHLFFDDIKKDQALFTLCLKKLGTIITSDKFGISPSTLLAELSQDKIDKLLSLPELSNQMHSFDPSMKAQATRIRHSIISSSAAEVLAEKAKIDPDFTFACAAVRQLGLNLIAWNYPRIYSKALSSISKGEQTLEQALFKALGYSPLQLGARASLDWSKSKEAQMVLNSDNKSIKQAKIENDNENKDINDAASILRFCEMGETLAQANDPEQFPAAAARWESVVSEINSLLGPQSLKIIQSKAEKLGEGYSSISPTMFKTELSADKNLKFAKNQIAQSLLEQNVNATRCPQLFVEKFRGVYENVIPGQASPVAVKNLIDVVVPALGFIRGCVYLIDNKRMQAVPMLRIGDAPLDRYRALNCSDSGTTTHPVIEALSYTTPIIQENAFVNGDRVSHITGVFGTREKVGVLYMEMSLELASSDRQQALLYYKAVRQCLNDCLNMK